MLTEESFDIFFSHTWSSKKSYYLSEVHNFLVKEGYRVFYDEHDMGANIQQSMYNGVRKSSVVLICLNKDYQNRPNCMFELNEAYAASQDPSLNVKIVLLVLEKDVFTWATPDVKTKCNLQYNMFVDISGVYEPSHGRWNKDSWGPVDSPTPEMTKALAAEMGKLVKRIKQDDCYPSVI